MAKTYRLQNALKDVEAVIEKFECFQKEHGQLFSIEVGDELDSAKEILDCARSDLSFELFMYKKEQKR